LVWILSTRDALADRDAILGTIDGSGNFVGGRTAYAADDGKIKEVESRLMADAPNEHPLDSKTYHLRVQCYGDSIIPLGKFSSGVLTLNWSTQGESASVSGNMIVASHYGDAANSGPFILSQQEGAAGGRAKLRATKGLSGDYDGFYLYLEYDNPSLGHPQMVSLSISTTQSIGEVYGESSAATSSPVPVFSNVSTLEKRFEFNKDVYINGSKALTEGADSLAIGPGSHAEGGNSFAIGTFATALKAGGVALGTLSNSIGLESAAICGGTAQGNFSFASSYGITSGQLSTAMAGGYALAESSLAIGGYDTTYWTIQNIAYGDNSIALGGVSNSAYGFASFSAGNWSKADTAYSIALGSMNTGGGSSATDWIENDPLLELGNGFAPRGSGDPSSAIRSNAITTLKNGQTTLTNKAWKSRPTTVSATADPSAATTDSEGEALVVDGHTRLRGKVVIEQPQGDISMGIYGN
jgi:hypothetical protein